MSEKDDYSQGLWKSPRPATTRPPESRAAFPEPPVADDPLPDAGRYQAFQAVERGAFGIKFYTGGPANVHAAYQYYQFMTDDGRGRIFDVVFGFFVVRVKGRNLEKVVQAIEARRCVFLQQYQPRAGWPEPAKGEPVIERIEITFKPEARTTMLEKPQTSQSSR